MARQIGTLGTIDTLTIGSDLLGSRTFTNLTSLITLCYYANSNLYSTGRRPQDSAGYAVTAAKTLTIHAMQIAYVSAPGDWGAYIYQADNDSGVDSATAPTSPVYAGGTKRLSQTTFFAVSSNPVGLNIGMPVQNVRVAATKYCTMEKITGAQTFSAVLYGYET